MSSYENNESWIHNNKDNSNISINIKQHIKNGLHRAKYTFSDDPTDIIDLNIQTYDGFDHIKALHEYLEEMNLGQVEFTVFKCKSKSKIPAHYANIKLGNVSLASSFPEKYSLPEVAQQVAARKALSVLKKTHSYKNIPITQDMSIVAERLEKELQKNYAGLFCDKVENIYKEVYSEQLPSDWLILLGRLNTNIVIEDLPNQNKSILYYDASPVDKKKHKELLDIPTTESSENLFVMKLVDKTERSVTVTSLDSNNNIWVLFVHDSINDDYDTLFKLMNMPSESKHFIKMFNIEISDVYAVQIQDVWYRFKVSSIEDDSITGIFIDLGIEFCVTKNNVMFLPPKFLKVSSQAIKCTLTSLFFAPYFQVAQELFHKMLFGKEFTLVPDNIENDVPLVTLYDGKCNMNNVIREAIIEKTNFNKIHEKCEKAILSYIANGYVYLHPSSETLTVMESILDSISASRPLDTLYSKNSISPHKLYLVKCPELNLWSRAIVHDFIFTDQKFKVYFIDYGNYGFIDQDKFIDLQSFDLLLSTIGPQALKVSFHLFPPENLIDQSRSKALYEMMIDKSLEINVISTNSDGIQVVEIFDADDQNPNRLSFNTQLYQSV
ncbi:tudor domain-containing protein 7-like [Melanaphis sacchari]|uniref:Tudor domain-containing protein 7 n=1 Tax=Melanaphis sacchari TaxID=742174 RepID=A0A2H8TFX0_9HEMI|nr:tudor domain-containing protein 7-like [Melanaphis sacchari]